MRDKDSQLIFENYRNKIIVNEAAALAVPLGMGIAEFLGLAATAVGATALAQSISEKSDQISKFFNFAEVNQDKVEQFKLLASSQDNSPRGQYELLNLAKSLNVPAISNLLKSSETILEMERQLLDPTIDSNYVIELGESIIFSLEQNLSEIISISDKMNIPIISTIIANFATTTKQELAALKQLAKELGYEVRKGGGGGKKPNKDGFFEKLKIFISKIWNYGKTGKIFIIFVGLAILGKLGLGNVTGWLISQTATAAGKGAADVATGTAEGFGIDTSAIGKPKPAPEPTPKQGKFTPSRYIPEGEDESTTSTAKASPTPYKKKGNWGN